MTNSLLRWPAIALVISPLVFLSPGCVVADDGYDGYGYRAGPGYYEPYGVDYGGWGPDYRVGPYHDGGHHSGSHPDPHTYRSPPESHTMPSLPSRSPARGSGSHGGGHGEAHGGQR